MVKETKKNKIVALLLALLISLAMWLYVITVVSPESEAEFHNVPVVLQGESVLADRKLMFTLEEKPTVTLTLIGNRSDLNKLNASNITVTVDLTRIYESGHHELQYNIAFPGDIPNGAVSVKSREPGNLPLDVERRVVNKPVDVTVNTVINGVPTKPATGFEVMETNLNREQILISGPSSVVDKIAMARIDVDMANRKISFGEDFFITLCDKDGQPVDSEWVEVDYNSVFLEAIIHKVKEVPVTVNVVPGGGASLETGIVEPSVASIKVSGTEDDLKELDAMLVDGKLLLDTIDLGQYERDTVNTYKLEMPDGVKLHADTDVVSVKITFPELTVVDILTQKFEFVNLSEELKAEVLVPDLTVRVRGLTSGIETLMREQVKVVLDMSNAIEGENKIIAQIEITNDKLPGAGALGTYEVLVDVQQANGKKK